jgi:hypothetical protein
MGSLLPILRDFFLPLKVIQYALDGFILTRSVFYGQLTIVTVAKNKKTNDKSPTRMKSITKNDPCVFSPKFQMLNNVFLLKLFSLIKSFRD